ncbi:hypothetical protein IGJ94_000259 [Enterococcus sp. AZ153]|uniref:hypothetical protein n=1 Tax=unclassified Enterococcus TaxID=2608891 RepID=UPI003F244E09
MSISDWIQIIAIVVSLVISVISILQTRKSLKITEENIKAESRPYLSFYVEYSQKNPEHKFFVIKNFGKTAAKVNRISFDKNLDKYTDRFKFSSLIGGTIAPGQKFTSFIEPNYKETLTVILSYEDVNKQEYEETFVVKTDIASSLLWVKEDTPEKAIRETGKILIKTIKNSSKK